MISTTISVLISTYNTDFVLFKRALDSVIQQTYEHVEIIVIDDGSNNDPNNLLINYVKKHEQNVRYIRHKNCGQSISINRGLAISSGTFIAILDADDEYEAHHLQNCINQMDDADLIASTTKTIVSSIDDYYVPDKYNHQQLIHVDDCVLFATLFGRKEVFTSLPFKNIYAADADFFEVASKSYKVKKVDLRSYIYYRNNPSSICSVLKNKYSFDSN